MPFSKDKKYLYVTVSGPIFPARFVEHEPTVGGGRHNLFYVHDPEKAIRGHCGFYASVDNDGKNTMAHIEEAPVYTNWYKRPGESFYRVYVHGSEAEARDSNTSCAFSVSTAFPLVIPSK